MVPLQIVGGILGIVTHIPLFIEIYRNEVKQNFTTWFLWAVLDIIISITTIIENGNFYLSAGYAVGASSVAILLLTKKQVALKWFEVLVIFLVIICLVVWYKVGSRATIAVTVITIVISSWPILKDAWEKPFDVPIELYLIFALADLLSFVGGDGWSIEERLYAFTQLSIGIILMVVSIKKRKERYAGAL